MKSNFSFKNLLKRLPNITIPKEFIFFGVGISGIVLIGLIVGNMYLQEMLFIEGQEKSIQIFTEEELREYGEIYKEMSLDFENNIGYLIEDYANRTNRAGEKIHYGIYNHEHPTDDTHKIKMHENGRNENMTDTNEAGERYPSELDDSFNDFKLKDSYIDTNEFRNGVTIKYSKTSGRADGESNFQDILTVVSMVIDQKQSKNESTVDVKSKIPDLIRRLFRISHTYTGESTELYSCEKGCRVLFYYCNEIDNKYAGTGIDLQPFSINPHSDFDGYEYTDEDFEIHEPENECVICGHNGKGCVKDSHPCFHGTYYSVSYEGSKVFECKHSVGDNPDSYGCENFEEKPFCSHFECNHENECPHDNEEGIGCAGCYECKGHDHWNCPGHYYVCCMGHTDITVNVKIMYIDEIINVIKNGYNVGLEDETESGE